VGDVVYEVPAKKLWLLTFVTVAPPAAAPNSDDANNLLERQLCCANDKFYFAYYRKVTLGKSTILVFTPMDHSLELGMIITISMKIL
jgi:hypothetical protein